MNSDRNKESLIAQYIRAYKDVHRVKPRGLNLLDWTCAELAQGIRVMGDRIA